MEPVHCGSNSILKVRFFGTLCRTFQSNLFEVSRWPPSLPCGGGCARECIKGEWSVDARTESHNFMPLSILSRIIKTFLTTLKQWLGTIIKISKDSSKLWRKADKTRSLVTQTITRMDILNKLVHNYNRAWGEGQVNSCVSCSARLLTKSNPLALPWLRTRHHPSRH